MREEPLTLSNEPGSTAPKRDKYGQYDPYLASTVLTFSKLVQLANSIWPVGNK